jgi:hypothetical protein
MPNALQELVSGSLAAATAVAGVSATYRRGDEDIPVTVIRGKRLYRTDNSFGASIAVRTERMFLQASDLGEIVPRRGDEIRIVTEAKTRTWEVVPDPDGKIWSYTDMAESQISVCVADKTVIRS